MKKAFYYIQGNIRYYLYYSKKFNKFLPKHIKKQIDYRLKVMDQICLKVGTCMSCGCETPHLQMSDKSCGNSCYPPMFNKKEFIDYLNKKEIFKNKNIWKYDTISNNHRILKNNVVINFVKDYVLEK